MKKTIIYFIMSVVISAIIGACKSDEDKAATSNILTCTGTSSGSGPTFGSVTLEEATYLSSCLNKVKYQFEFKNNSSAQYTSYTFDDSSCSGTATSSSSVCMESITVSSTTVTKPVYHADNSSTGDNVTGYNTTGILKHDSSTRYMNFSAESTSVFWHNVSSSQSQLDSNAYYLFKFTKQ